MERGIITTAADITNDGNLLSMRTSITPEKCRYYALYWDKVVVTDSNFFSIGLSQDMKLLEQVGIVRKVTIESGNGTFKGSDIARIHFQGLAEIATNLTNKNPGQWIIHQSGNQLIVPASMSKDLVTADFELTRCLPVPKPDIPLDKLLEFKLKRADELIALRTTLDELYLEISKSADIPRSKIVQIQRLEQAISDLDKIAKQSWGDRLLASRKVSLDLNYGSVINGAATAGVVGATYSNPLASIVAGVSHALISSLKFEVSISNQLESAQGKQLELSYISSIKKEDITN